MSIQAEGTALSALEREAEHTRADLIHTVDELHSRVSPQAIKEEVKAYARETGSDLTTDRDVVIDNEQANRPREYRRLADACVLRDLGQTASHSVRLSQETDSPSHASASRASSSAPSTPARPPSAGATMSGNTK